MAGYLDEYGVADQRRERLVKRIAITSGSAIIIGLILYFTLRTHSQERIVGQFLAELKDHNYGDAYKMWGCPEACKYYPQDQFLEDWGPKSKFADSSAWKIQHVDYCDEGVVFDLSYPNTEDDIGLWVNRSTGIVSFNPTPRCPGRHLELGAFFKSLFSSS